MGDDINTLWALIAGLLLLVANCASIVMIEGASRARAVTSGVGRHLLSFAGAVLGVVVCGYAIGLGRGGDLTGSQGYLLTGVELSDPGRSGGSTIGLDVFGLLAVSVLFSTLVMGPLSERATPLAHAVVGLFSGGLLVPVAVRAARPSGLLGSVEVGSASFVDVAATGLFSMVGWFGLIGAMMIGPRLGRVGSTGQIRAIPGRSPLLVVVGAMVFLLSSPGLLTVFRPGLWSASTADAAVVLLLASAVGAFVSAAIAYQRHGDVRTHTVTMGAVAGLVAATGDPFDASPLFAIVVGALGASAAIAADVVLGRNKVDDPFGAVSVFGAAGVIGGLATQFGSLEQLLAQLIGQLIVAAWAILLAGVTFGTLRLARALRVDPQVEVVGLDR